MIKSNELHGTNDPPLSISTYKETKKAHEVVIHGPSVVKYSKTPLSCGARCWIETDSMVEAA